MTQNLTELSLLLTFVLRRPKYRDLSRRAGVQVYLTSATSVPRQTTYRVLVFLTDCYCVDWTVVVHIGNIQPCTQKLQLISPGQTGSMEQDTAISVMPKRTSLCAKCHQAINMYCHLENGPAQQNPTFERTQSLRLVALHGVH